MRLYNGWKHLNLPARTWELTETIGVYDMQLAIELPDELGQQVLQHGNVQQFVQRAIERMLSEEKRSFELLNDLMDGLPEIAGFENKDPLAIQQGVRDESLDKNKRHFLNRIRNIKPVKAPFSSEEMIAMLREGKEQQLIDAQTSHDK